MIPYTVIHTEKFAFAWPNVGMASPLGTFRVWITVFVLIIGPWWIDLFASRKRRLRYVQHSQQPLSFVVFFLQLQSTDVMSCFNYWLTILCPTFEARAYSRTCKFSWWKSDTTYSCFCTTKSVGSVFLTACFSIRSQAWYFVLCWSQHFTACYMGIHSAVQHD